MSVLVPPLAQIDLVLVKTIWILRADHRAQHTHGKIVDVIPDGGRQTVLRNVTIAFLNCNPKLGELHFAKRTSAWIPRRCNSSPKGSASWTIDHKNSFILGEHFAVQISLIQSKIGVAAKQRYPLCLDYLVEASESLQPFERESFVKLNDRDDDATRLSDDDGDATRLSDDDEIERRRRG